MKGIAVIDGLSCAGFYSLFIIVDQALLGDANEGADPYMGERL